MGNSLHFFRQSSEIVKSRLVHLGIDKAKRKKNWKLEMNPP